MAFRGSIIFLSFVLVISVHTYAQQDSIGFQDCDVCPKMCNTVLVQPWWRSSTTWAPTHNLSCVVVV